MLSFIKVAWPWCFFTATEHWLRQVAGPFSCISISHIMPQADCPLYVQDQHMFKCKQLVLCDRRRGPQDQPLQSFHQGVDQTSEHCTSDIPFLSKRYTCRPVYMHRGLASKLDKKKYPRGIAMPFPHEWGGWDQGQELVHFSSCFILLFIWMEESVIISYSFLKLTHKVMMSFLNHSVIFKCN